MLIQEPKIEFVAIDMEDIIVTSAGASVVICASGAARDSDFPDLPIGL